jgi:hypothetical protein
MTSGTSAIASGAITQISERIVLIRGQRVLLDEDLAALYEVPTKRFNEAVKRNQAKFPDDFCFLLSAEEYAALRSQFATLKPGRGQHRKYLPRVFTEHQALKLDAFANITRKQLKEVFEALRQLTTPPDPPKRPIGFGIPEQQPKPKAKTAKTAKTAKK